MIAGLLKFARKAIVAILATTAVIVLTQDIQIFPGVLSGLFYQEPPTFDLPPGVERVMIDTADGKQIDAWRLAPDVVREPTNVAIVFHGNGGTVRNFFGMQRWLAEQGIISYGFDYRGFGNSSGWPSEQGIYNDSDAVLQYALKREGVLPKAIIPVGISIGTAAAARVAANVNADFLVLFSPYASLPDLVRKHSMLFFLSPFLWYEFPTRKYVERLENTCLIVASGGLDNLIPETQTDAVVAAYRGHAPVFHIREAEASHNYVFNLTKDKVREKLSDCQTKRLSDTLERITPNK